MMRDSVLFYRSFVDAIDILPEEEQLKAYRAIARYGLDGIEPELESLYGAVFLLAKPQIDANNRRYENGCKGGAPKGNQNATKSNQDTTKKQAKNNQATTKKQAKEKDKEKDKDNINTPKGVIGGKETQAAMFDRLIVGRAISHDVTDALREWVEYKSQKRQPYKEVGMRSLITQTVNKGAECGPVAVIQAIRDSMASNYQGIVWPKDPHKNKFNNAPKRMYDMQDTERMLVATN